MCVSLPHHAKVYGYQLKETFTEKKRLNEEKLAQVPIKFLAIKIIAFLVLIFLYFLFKTITS